MEKIVYSAIEFSELENYNDSNSVVLLGLILEENECTELNSFLHEINLCQKEKQIIGVYRITGNVLCEEGRTDWLVVFNNEETMQFNPIVRLSYGQMIKWTSDFIDNYANDYLH